MTKKKENFSKCSTQNPSEPEGKNNNRIIKEKREELKEKEEYDTFIEERDKNKKDI